MVKPSRNPSYGSKRAHLSPSSHFDRPLDADEALGRRLLDDARRLQQEHERAGRAIHDRHFGRGQVDVGVVDAQARERGHQVLDRQHLAARLGQAGAQHRLGDELRIGRNVDDRIQVHAPEDDARVHGRRTQREVDLLAAVQPDAGGADHVLEGALLEHAGSSLGAAGRTLPARTDHGRRRAPSGAEKVNTAV